MGMSFSSLVLSDGVQTVLPRGDERLFGDRIELVARCLRMESDKRERTSLRKCYSLVRDDPRKNGIGIYEHWGIVLGIDVSGFMAVSIPREIQQALGLFSESRACVCTYNETVNSFGAMLIVQNTLQRAFWFDSSEGILFNVGDWTENERLLIEKHGLVDAPADEILRALSDQLVFAITDYVVSEDLFAFDSDIELCVLEKPGANPFDIRWLKRFF